MHKYFRHAIKVKYFVQICYRNIIWQYHMCMWKYKENNYSELPVRYGLTSCLAPALAHLAPSPLSCHRHWRQTWPSAGRGSWWRRWPLQPPLGHWTPNLDGCYVYIGWENHVSVNGWLARSCTTTFTLVIKISRDFRLCLDT